MRKTRTRFICIIICIVCVLNTAPLFAAASSVSDIESRLQQIASTGNFKPGTINKKDKCWKFVNAVSGQLFGVDIPSINKNNPGLLCDNKNWECIGKADNSADLKALFKKAQPGDIYQGRIGGSQHTTMFYSVSSKDFTWYHSTGGDGKQTVTQTVTIESKPWGDPFFNAFNRTDVNVMASVYRCKHNVATGSIKTDGLTDIISSSNSSNKKPTWSVKTTKAEKQIDGSYTLYGTAKSSGVPIKGVGMYIGTSNDQNKMTKLGSDNGGSSYSTNMWYNTGKYKYGLKPGTYYYRAYAIINGQEVLASNVASFVVEDSKSEEDKTIPDNNSQQTQIIDIRANVTTGKAKDITKTSAVLYGSGKVTGEKISGCGMYLGTSKSNMTELGRDRGGSNTEASFWYSTSKYGRTLEPGTTYYYQAYVLVNGQYYWGEIKSFKTDPVPVETPVSETPVKDDIDVNVTTKEAKDVTKTSATLYGYGEVTGGTLSGCGMYLGTSKSNMTELGQDRGGSNKKADFWYSTSKYGRTLEPGTTYYYQAYALVNGQYYWGEIKSFKTDPVPVETPVEETPVNVNVATKGTKDVTKTSATLYGYGEVTGGTLSGCGMYLGTSKSNMTELGQDRGGSNKKADFWYSTSKYGRTLEPGTTYYYQAYVLVNGQYYWGEVKSFKTDSAPAAAPAKVNVSVTTKGTKNVTKTSATLYGYGEVTGGTLSGCGMYLGTSKSNMTELGQDRGGSNKKADFWYSTSKYGRKLKSGTTYYYQAYVLVNGQYYWGDIKSFKTK